MVQGVESLDETRGGARRWQLAEPEVLFWPPATAACWDPSSATLTYSTSGGCRARLAEKAPARGLRFIGYVPRPGRLGYVGKEARRAAKAIVAGLSGVAWPTTSPEVTIV